MLGTSEVSITILWSKWEDFCKPQANEPRAIYDLFKSFIQAGSCVDEWYNTGLKWLALCSYHQETTSILSRDIFLFHLQNWDFLAKCFSTTFWRAAKIRLMAKKVVKL